LLHHDRKNQIPALFLPEQQSSAAYITLKVFFYSENYKEKKYI